MAVDASAAHPLRGTENPASWDHVAILLALIAAALAYAFAPFANDRPFVAGVAALFPMILIALVGLPIFHLFRLGPRLLVILMALRPLVDVSQSFQSVSAGFALSSSSRLSLQEGFAAFFGLLLITVWLLEDYHGGYTKLPNLLLILLLGVTSVSWWLGGLGEGTRGFVRTAWGLLVALLLGSLFRTERQVDVFIRTVFYSSVFVLLALCLNLSNGMSGTAADPLWRLGGQYGTPNALAGVVLSFFLYGLYVVSGASTVVGKIISLALLSLLAIVIVCTQSRTAGALMLFSVCFCLWANRRRRLLYGVIIPVLLSLFLSAEAIGWRVVSSFSIASKDTNPDLLTLQGRVLLWGNWLKDYMDASLFHKIFGLGWGVMLRNFLLMKLPTSSVTENSFLWFLVGTGALGLLTFCAYLFWVFFKSWIAWRRAPHHEFGKKFALFVFLTVICFVIEAFTTDVASAPNANLYIFAVMSIFVFRCLGRNLQPIYKLGDVSFRNEPHP